MRNNARLTIYRLAPMMLLVASVAAPRKWGLGK